MSSGWECRILTSSYFSRLLCNAPSHALVIYDILLKIYGFLIIYALAFYELLVQYLWLFKYRTGRISGPNESLYKRHSHILITGGLGGVGREVVKKCLEFDNEVVLVDFLPHAEAEKLIQTLGDSSKVKYFQVDLRDLPQVYRFCEELKGLKIIPKILHFNAGIMHAPYELCAGMESQFLVSYLSHCLILSELYPLLQPGFRVVFTTSVCHKPGYINLDDLHGKKAYSAHLAYCQAKLCQILLAKYLSSKMNINTVHPGVVDTGLYRHVLIKHILAPISIMNTAEAALCPTYALLSDEMNERSGEYLEFCKPVKPTEKAFDEKIQRKLFESTVELLKPYTNFAKLTATASVG